MDNNIRNSFSHFASAELTCDSRSGGYFIKHISVSIVSIVFPALLLVPLPRLISAVCLIYRIFMMCIVKTVKISMFGIACKSAFKLLFFLFVWLFRNNFRLFLRLFNPFGVMKIISRNNRSNIYADSFLVLLCEKCHTFHTLCHFGSDAVFVIINSRFDRFIRYFFGFGLACT